MNKGCLGNTRNVLIISSIIIGRYLISCSQQAASLVSVKHLSWYPSGSAVAYNNSRVYIMGDNTTHLLILDSALNTVDSIRIIAGLQPEIEKEVKPDLEAMALLQEGEQLKLLLLGSGSVPHYREKAFTLAITDSNQLREINLHSFYARLNKSGIKQLNIEGATTINNEVILANRGNKGNPYNHLIIASSHFLDESDTTAIRFIALNIAAKNGEFSGVSGLEYAPLHQQLLLTVSTENTADSYQDGTIGKSYLMVINNIDKKMGAINLQPDRIIDLGDIDKKFVGQKIESVAVIKETTAFTDLVLVADNDAGDTWLFLLRLLH